MTHGFYRPSAGVQEFQLPPNGWHFADGHSPKLELLGQSDPSGSASQGDFTVTVESLELLLPTLEVDPVLRSQSVGAHCTRRPRTECQAPRGGGKSRLALSHGKTDGKDKLTWKWQGRRGQSDDFQQAVGSDGNGYALCVYDGANAPLAQASAPADVTCGRKACWVTTKKRVKYRDAQGRNTGLRTVVLTPRNGGSRIVRQGHRGEAGALAPSRGAPARDRAARGQRGRLLGRVVQRGEEEQVQAVQSLIRLMGGRSGRSSRMALSTS